MEVHDDSYELFRRAVVERDTEAWAVIATRYRNLLINWATRCRAHLAAGERSEDLADRALARAWAALLPERFGSFPNTATLLGYLRTCVTATVIDAARAQAAHDRAVHSVEQDAVPTPEQITLARLGRDELWQLVNRLITSEAERVVVVERFVFDLPPRAIQARHPALFPDVSVVYASIRNLCERLRRNQDFRRYYAERRTI
jgi:DNA-directed RNA polymerase specialized sigma24 family protein